MKRRALRILAAVLGVSIAAAERADACSCMRPGPPCEATWNADAVFAGIVRSVDWETGPSSMVVRVRFDIERAFVNSAPGPVELVSTFTSCTYPFTAGRRYLVYAWKTSSNELAAGQCTRTRPLEEAQEDLRYLSAIPNAQTGARVFGRVTHWQRDPFEEEAVDYGPIKDIVVNVRGDAFSRDATTDENGRYELARLPTGKHLITLIVPPGFDNRSLERELEIRDARACSQHDFQITRIARAAGIVVDSAGHPLAGIEIDAVATELAAHRPPRYQRPAKTDANGRFELDDLPPGSYVFGVNLTSGIPGLGAFGINRTLSGPATFLPGTAVASEAAVFELKPGDRIDVGVLRLGTR